MGHFTREVKEACELIGAEYQILEGDEAKEIYLATDKKFFTSERKDERWNKQIISENYISYYDDEAWKTIWQLTQRDPIYLMLSGAENFLSLFRVDLS